MLIPIRKSVSLALGLALLLSQTGYAADARTLIRQAKSGFEAESKLRQERRTSPSQLSRAEEAKQALVSQKNELARLELRNAAGAVKNERSTIKPPEPEPPAVVII